MKTKAKLSLLVLVVIILLTSCATSVRVNYQTPSEIDMGQYKNLALASAVEFKGFQAPSVLVKALDGVAFVNMRMFSTYNSSLAKDVANYATTYLEKTLVDSKFFNITPPAITDAFISSSIIGVNSQAELQRSGIDAVIIPKIVSMSANEYISSEQYFETDISNPPVGGVYPQIAKTRYLLTQTAEMVFSYTIIDVATMTVYDTKNFSDKRENTTLIDEFGFGLVKDMADYFYKMIDGFQYHIASQLVPTTRSASFDLMSNKPKSSAVENAYDLVKDGNSGSARELFLKTWNQEKHVPSGYNAAIILASNGKIDEAINLLTEVATYTSDPTVLATLNKLKSIKVQNSDAKKQNAGERIKISDSDTNINIFQVIMGN